MQLILLVQPDAEIAQNIKQKLIRDDSRRMHHAENAEEAFAKASDRRYDLLVVAWALPQGTGPHLVQRLRKDGCAMPILLLAGRDGSANCVRGLESGADDYLTLPYAPRELEARVRALFRRRSEWSTIDTGEIGPLQVDGGRRQARMDGEPLELHEKEFDLLRLLVDKSPNLVSHGAIAARVWGANGVSDDAIDGTVSALREKMSAVLGKPNGRLRLETVRGIGHRLAVNGREGDE